MNIEKLTQAINSRLDELVAEEIVEYNPLFQAARYSLLSFGKRLRPLILLTTLQDLGCSASTGLDAACSLELIHTYSLIHDDLPCMDNDDIRRNQPSLHKAYDEGLALLTGDYLLTFAFEVLCQDLTLSEGIRFKLIRTLATMAGAKGMIGGQVADIFFKNTPHSESIDLIHQGKTGALFRAAFLFAGIIAEVSEKELSSLNLIGSLFGKAFQYMDDIQDFYTKKHEFVNIVLYLGLEKTLESIDLMQLDIMNLLNNLERPLPLLTQLISENFTNFFHQISNLNT